MRKNVIILTHGWTGSSVFTGLIGRAGYWCGDSTFEKSDYNTNENSELIELNKRLLDELGYTSDHEHEFDRSALDELAQRSKNIDLGPYREFVEKCEVNTPWIWKDPRLTWTIRIWAQLLDLDKVAFVILTRDNEQAWITSNLRRHIQTPRFTRAYNEGITASLREFLQGVDQPCVEFEFEDLQLQPEKTVMRLNEFLGIELDMEDLKSVYTLPLYRKSKGFKDKLKATAIYIKNYRQRYR